MVLDIAWIGSKRSWRWLFFKTKSVIQEEEPIRLQMREPKIEIGFRSGAPYEISEIIQGRIKSEVRVGIRNSGDSTLSNCRVYIESVSPPPPTSDYFQPYWMVDHSYYVMMIQKNS